MIWDDDDRCLVGQDHDESVKYREKEKVKTMTKIGQLYGVEKQQIANLNWAMEQLADEEGELPRDIDKIAKEVKHGATERYLGGRCLADENEQYFLKAEKIGCAILYLADDKAKFTRIARDSWNETYNGCEYNIKVEVVRIDG